MKKSLSVLLFVCATGRAGCLTELRRMAQHGLDLTDPRSYPGYQVAQEQGALNLLWRSGVKDQAATLAAARELAAKMGIPLMEATEVAIGLANGTLRPGRYENRRRIEGFDHRSAYLDSQTGSANYAAQKAASKKGPAPDFIEDTKAAQAHARKNLKSNEMGDFEAVRLATLEKGGQLDRPWFDYFRSQHGFSPAQAMDAAILYKAVGVNKADKDAGNVIASLIKRGQPVEELMDLYRPLKKTDGASDANYRLLNETLRAEFLKEYDFQRGLTGNRGEKYSHDEAYAVTRFLMTQSELMARDQVMDRSRGIRSLLATPTSLKKNDFLQNLALNRRNGYLADRERFAELMLDHGLSLHEAQGIFSRHSDRSPERLQALDNIGLSREDQIRLAAGKADEGALDEVAKLVKANLEPVAKVEGLLQKYDTDHMSHYHELRAATLPPEMAAALTSRKLIGRSEDILKLIAPLGKEDAGRYQTVLHGLKNGNEVDAFLLLKSAGMDDSKAIRAIKRFQPHGIPMLIRLKDFKQDFDLAADFLDRFETLEEAETYLRLAQAGVLDLDAISMAKSHLSESDIRSAMKTAVSDAGTKPLPVYYQQLAMLVPDSVARQRMILKLGAHKRVKAAVKMASPPENVEIENAVKFVAELGENVDLYADVKELGLSPNEVVRVLKNATPQNLIVIKAALKAGRDVAGARTIARKIAEITDDEALVKEAMEVLGAREAYYLLSQNVESDVPAAIRLKKAGVSQRARLEFLKENGADDVDKFLSVWKHAKKADDVKALYKELNGVDAVGAFSSLMDSKKLTRAEAVEVAKTTSDDDVPNFLKLVDAGVPEKGRTAFRNNGWDLSDDGWVDEYLKVFNLDKDSDEAEAVSRAVSNSEEIDNYVRLAQAGVPKASRLNFAANFDLADGGWTNVYLKLFNLNKSGEEADSISKVVEDEDDADRFVDLAKQLSIKEALAVHSYLDDDGVMGYKNLKTAGVPEALRTRFAQDNGGDEMWDGFISYWNVFRNDYTPGKEKDFIRESDNFDTDLTDVVSELAGKVPTAELRQAMKNYDVDQMALYQKLVKRNVPQKVREYVVSKLTSLDEDEAKGVARVSKVLLDADEIVRVLTSLRNDADDLRRFSLIKEEATISVDEALEAAKKFDDDDGAKYLRYRRGKPGRAPMGHAEAMRRANN